MKKLILVLFVFLMGCSGSKVLYVKPDFNAPDFVAMLPADNYSNDLTAPETVVSAISSGLVGLGYFPLVTPVQQKVLQEAGFSDGGQINAFDLSDMCKQLGVDGLVRTRIDDFNKINIGVYLKSNVQATVTLYDSQSEKLWQIESKYVKQKMNLSLSSAATGLVVGLGSDLFAKILGNYLRLESSMVSGMMVKKGNSNSQQLRYADWSQK